MGTVTKATERTEVVDVDAVLKSASAQIVPMSDDEWFTDWREQQGDRAAKTCGYLVNSAKSMLAAHKYLSANSHTLREGGGGVVDMYRSAINRTAMAIEQLMKVEKALRAAAIDTDF